MERGVPEERGHFHSRGLLSSPHHEVRAVADERQRSEEQAGGLKIARSSGGPSGREKGGGDGDRVQLVVPECNLKEVEICRCVVENGGQSVPVSK